jgi:hypothetical protein
MSDVNSIARDGPGDRRRWLILTVIGIAQLMVVLDDRVTVLIWEASDKTAGEAP